MNLRKKWQNFMLETKYNDFWNFILFLSMSVFFGGSLVLSLWLIFLLAANIGLVAIPVVFAMPIILLVGRVLLQKE